MYCRCKSSNCRGNIIGVKLQTSEFFLNQAIKSTQSFASKKKKSIKQVEETGRLLYTTVYVSRYTYVFYGFAR